MKAILLILCLFVSAYSLTVQEYLGDEKIEELKKRGYSTEQITTFAQNKFKEEKKEAAEQEARNLKIREDFLEIAKKRAQSINILLTLCALSFIGILIVSYIYVSKKRVERGQKTHLNIFCDAVSKYNKRTFFSYVYVAIGIVMVLLPPKFQQKVGENKFQFFIVVDKIDFYFFLYEIISYLLIGGIMYLVFYKNKTFTKEEHERD